MNPQENFFNVDEERANRRLIYLLFIGAIALMAFFNALFYYLSSNTVVRQVFLLMDFVYAMIFLVDFFLRLRFAEDRRHYFLHWGWFDLLTGIPGFPALRLLRGVRAFVVSRSVFAAAPEELGEEARNRLGESVLLFVIVLVILVVSLGSVAVVDVESGAPGASIETGYDAVWWSMVTISTVGYGDMVPVTPAGRVIGVFMIVVGVVLFTTLASYLASSFTDSASRRQRQEQIEVAAKHQQTMEAMLRRVLQLEETIAASLRVEQPAVEPDEQGGEDS